MWRRRDNKPLTEETEVPGKQSILDPFWELVLPDESDDESWDSAGSMSIETETEIQESEKKVKGSEDASFSLASFSLGSKTKETLSLGSKSKEGSIGSTLGSRSFGNRGQSSVGTKSYESASTFSKVASLGAFSSGSTATNPRGSKSIGSFYSGSIDSKLSSIRQKKVESRAPLDSFWEFVLGDKDDADDTVWESVDMVSAASSTACDDVSQVMSETFSGDEGSYSANRTGKKSKGAKHRRSIRRTNSDSGADRRSFKFWKSRRSGSSRKTRATRTGLLAAASAAAILRPSVGGLRGAFSTDKDKSSIPKREEPNKPVSAVGETGENVLKDSGASKRGLSAKKAFRVGRRGGVSVNLKSSAPKKPVSSTLTVPYWPRSKTASPPKQSKEIEITTKSYPKADLHFSRTFFSKAKTPAADTRTKKDGSTKLGVVATNADHVESENGKRTLFSSSARAKTAVAAVAATSASKLTFPNANTDLSTSQTTRKPFFSSKVKKAKNGVDAATATTKRGSSAKRDFAVPDVDLSTPRSKRTLFASSAKDLTVVAEASIKKENSTKVNLVETGAISNRSTTVAKASRNQSKTLGGSAAVAAALVSITAATKKSQAAVSLTEKQPEQTKRPTSSNTMANSRPVAATTKFAANNHSGSVSETKVKTTAPAFDPRPDPDKERGSKSFFGTSAKSADRVRLPHSKNNQDTASQTRLSKATSDSRREIEMRHARSKRGHWEWEIDSAAIPVVSTVRGSTRSTFRNKKTVRFADNTASPQATTACGTSLLLPAVASSMVLAGACIPQENTSQERATPGIRKSSYHGTEPEKLFDLRPEIDPDVFQSSARNTSKESEEKTSFLSKIARSKALSPKATENQGAETSVWPAAEKQAETSLWPTTKEELELQLKAAALLVPIGNEVGRGAWLDESQTRNARNVQLRPQPGTTKEETDDEGSSGPTDEEMSLEDKSDQSVASNHHQMLLQSLRNAKSSHQPREELPRKPTPTRLPETDVCIPQVNPSVTETSFVEPHHPGSSFLPVPSSTGMLGPTSDYDSDFDSDQDVGEIRRKLWGGEKYNNPSSAISPHATRLAQNARHVREARFDSLSSRRQDLSLVRAASPSSDQRSVVL